MGKRRKVEVVRLTEKTYDLMSDEGVKAAMQVVSEAVIKGKRVHLFGPLPCTAWSSYQHLNRYKLGAEFCKRLKIQRAASKKMLRNFRTLARHLKQLDPTATVSFEWPRFCSGWKLPLLKG